MTTALELTSPDRSLAETAASAAETSHRDEQAGFMNFAIHRGRASGPAPTVIVKRARRVVTGEAERARHDAGVSASADAATGPKVHRLHKPPAAAGGAGTAAAATAADPLAATTAEPAPPRRRRRAMRDPARTPGAVTRIVFETGSTSAVPAGAADAPRAADDAASFVGPDWQAHQDIRRGLDRLRQQVAAARRAQALRFL